MNEKYLPISDEYHEIGEQHPELLELLNFWRILPCWNGSQISWYDHFKDTAYLYTKCERMLENEKR